MRKIQIITLILLGIYYSVYAQDTDSISSFQRSQALKVYLDCAYCDLDYFNTNFTSVNYVVERTRADVYVQLTEMSTASGGSQYTMVFKGYGKFEKYDDTLVFSLPVYATLDKTRESILEHTKLGLVPFLLKTPVKQQMTLFIDEEGDGFNYIDQADPWKNWFFELHGGGSVNNEKTNKTYSLSGGIYISKVTPEIKFESSNYFSFSEQSFKLYDGDTVIYSSFSSQRSLSISNLFVKSVGNHFGVGATAEYLKSEYSNYNTHLRVGPAIEYNLYDYGLASTKQCRFIYHPTYEFSDYIDTTVYNETVDHRFTHSLAIMYTYLMDKWSIDAFAFGSCYLNDWSIFSTGGNVRLNYSFDKPKGLTVFGSCGFSYIKDQVGLRKDGNTPEDLLLETREMETEYNYNISIGISFSFGSLYNNIVNPRFTGR